MSDKELEEYINKIEPNFNSHLEKGTIEMSNEYYNLLEEKMIRLINENQELKTKIENAIEYINKYENIKAYYEYIDEDEYDEYNYDEDFKKELIHILQGE